MSYPVAWPEKNSRRINKSKGGSENLYGGLFAYTQLGYARLMLLRLASPCLASPHRPFLFSERLWAPTEDEEVEEEEERRSKRSKRRREEKRKGRRRGQPMIWCFAAVVITLVDHALDRSGEYSRSRASFCQYSRLICFYFVLPFEFIPIKGYSLVTRVFPHEIYTLVFSFCTIYSKFKRESLSTYYYTRSLLTLKKAWNFYTESKASAKPTPKLRWFVYVGVILHFWNENKVYNSNFNIFCTPYILCVPLLTPWPSTLLLLLLYFSLVCSVLRLVFLLFFYSWANLLCLARIYMYRMSARKKDR